jgi:hypothetical protein
VSGPFRPDDPSFATGYHGTAVAGIIGARWDGFGTDGISPFTHLLGAESRGAAAGEVASLGDRLLSYGAALAASWSLLRRAGASRPRLVNISLGMNHYAACYPRAGRTPRRCDPRQGTTTWGVPVADSECDGALARQRLSAAGAVFSQLVDAAQRGGDVLFVVGAANDSGPADGRDHCAPGVTGGQGMGLFPARFASPMAAAGLIEENPNVLVVEVVERNEDMRGPLRRAPYSNVGGHILAPGDGITSPRGGGAMSTVGAMSGTSAATPHVTGAAAWLLALNPRLSNTSLRALLLAQDGPAVEGTPTRARLFVPASVAQMDVAVPGVSVRTVRGARLLADMDDGTADGFTRVDRDAFGATLGPHTARRSPAQNAGAVDMADFRFLRDSALYAEGLTDSRCPEETFACDLNADGEPLRDAATELNPRALIVHQAPGGEGPAAAENLRALAAYFDDDPVQGWRATELPALMRSADFEVYPTDFLSRAGATAVEITLGGEAPEPMYAAPRREPLTDVRVGAAPVVLTSPLTVSPTVSVRVVGGRHDGRVLTSRRELSIGPGQSAVLFLNACALEPDTTFDVLSPYVPGCDPDAGVPPAGADAGLPAFDRGSADASVDAAAFDTCRTLREGSGPYVCFELTGSSLPTTYAVAYPPVGTATFQAYYYAAEGRTFVRMSGRPRVNGDFELVDVTFTTPGNAASSERWPTDVKPSTLRISFSDGDIVGGPGTLRLFDPIPGSDVSGITTVTRYAAPGGMIEGTFQGVGMVNQIHPSVARFAPVTVTGSFRVPRRPDA